MSWLTSPFGVLVLGAAVLLLLAVGLLLGLFLRATRGARGIKARVERLFLLPVRVRPLPKGHYFRAYWR